MPLELSEKKKKNTSIIGHREGYKHTQNTFKHFLSLSLFCSTALINNSTCNTNSSKEGQMITYKQVEQGGI